MIDIGARKTYLEIQWGVLLLLCHP